jgi:hypothetical protein
LEPLLPRCHGNQCVQCTNDDDCTDAATPHCSNDNVCVAQ